MLIHRRRCHRPRLRCYAHVASAPLVAALERISINEPEMAAGSSSSAGIEGPLPLSFPLSLYVLCLLDLGPLCTDEKERERNTHSIRALVDPRNLTIPTSLIREEKDSFQCRDAASADENKRLPTGI